MPKKKVENKFQYLVMILKPKNTYKNLTSMLFKIFKESR